MEAEFYQKAIEECFPQITVHAIKSLGGGSCRVFEVNAAFVFRFPDSPEVASGLAREKRLYDCLHRAFSFPIPRYEYFSTGGKIFEGQIVGYRKIPGEPLEGYELNDTQLRKLAPQIATFLSELHLHPFDECLKQAIEPFQPEKLTKWWMGFWGKIQSKVFPLLNSTEQKWTHRVIEEYAHQVCSPSFVALLHHGDLDASNILYDINEEGMSGIIDFEDAGMGDVAGDLIFLENEFGIEYVQEVLSYYRLGVDDNLIKRMSLLAKIVPFHEILYGVEYNDNESREHGLLRLRKKMDNHDKVGGWFHKSTSEARAHIGLSM